MAAVALCLGVGEGPFEGISPTACFPGDATLPGQDSNLGQGIQSPLCYHCTTGQWLPGLSFPAGKPVSPFPFVHPAPGPVKGSGHYRRGG